MHDSEGGTDSTAEGNDRFLDREARTCAERDRCASTECAAVERAAADAEFARAHVDRAGPRSEGPADLPRDWDPSGDALFFQVESQVLEVPVDWGGAGESPPLGAPEAVLSSLNPNPNASWGYGQAVAISPDGGRFVIGLPGEGESPSQLMLVENWFGELEETVGGKAHESNH